MPPDSTSRPYRGADPAERRAERRQRLMDAVVTVVGESGWESATVRRIATEAGVGPRFVYEGFADIEALAAATYDELGGRLVGNALVAVQSGPQDLPSVTTAAIGSILGELVAEPRRARFLLSDAPALASRRTALLHLAAQEYATAASQAGAMGSDDQLRASALMVAAGGLELIRAWLDGALTADVEQLATLIATSLTTLSTAMPDVL